MTIKTFFEKPGVYDAITKQQYSTVVSNFIQSKLWKSILEDFKSKEVFPFIQYYDDFETGNALGSHAGNHKIGAVYLQIPCLPPEFSSTLDSIFTALVFRAKDRTEYGNYKTFRPLLEELKFLEREGVTLNLPQKTTTIYFKLGLIVGDNLGIHSIFGLIESFVGNFSCRFCTLNKTQRFLATTEDPAYMRTISSYNYDIKLNNPSVTGINHECIFHEIRGYHN